MSVSSRKTAVRAVDASETRAPNPEAVEAPTSAPDARAEAPAPSQTAAPPAAAAPPPKKKRNLVLPVLLLALLAGGGYYGYQWWIDGRFMVSTDDAYIGGDNAVISPKVTGYVKSVEAKENSMVKAGDVLVRLDDGDYQNALDQAKSQLESQKLAVIRIDAQIEGGLASVEQANAQKMSAEATLQAAQLNFNRVTGLQAQSIVSRAELDNATSSLATSKANVASSAAAITSAQASIAVLKAQRQEAVAAIRTAELAVAKAQRDLDFTVLRAPYDGVIGNLAVQVGDLVSSGKRMASLVPVRNLYIDANFKETQLAKIEPGSKVKIHVDAYGDKPIEGTVESIAPGSGSVFSVLPPENATGNFTKVIQRVPVRIAIPQEALDSGHLRAGLSVVVDIDTRTAPGQANAAK